MTRRELLALGARVRRDGSPFERVRSWATTGAVAAVVLVVLGVCSAPGAAQARAERAWQRAPHVVEGTAGLEIVPRRTSVPGGVISSWLVVARDGAQAPPGISALPSPGTSYVSPALDRFLRSPEGEPFRAAFGRTVGRIEPVGLVDSSERVAYVGAEPGLLDLLPEGHRWKRPQSSFGHRSSPLPVAAWPWTLGVLVLLVGPLVSVVVAATRLADQAARRHLAALRLLGVSQRELGLVRLGMVGVPLSAGMVLGSLGFVIGARVLAGHEVAGRSWESGDVDLAVSGALGAGLVALVAAISARRVVSQAMDGTWAERRGRARRLPPLWMGMVPVVGLSLLAGIFALAPRTVVLDEFSMSVPLVAIHVLALAVAIVGLGVASPVLAAWGSARIARRGRGFHVVLAARSVLRDPCGPARWAGLLGALVLFGSLGVAYGEAVSEGYHALDDPPPGGFLVTDVSNPRLADELRAADVGIVAAGTEAWAVTDGDRGAGRHLLVVIARCDELAAADPRVTGCRPGTMAYRSRSFGGDGPADLDVGGTVVPSAAPGGDIRQGIDGSVLRRYHRVVEPDTLEVDLTGVPPTFIAVRPNSSANRDRALAIVSTDPIASVGDRAGVLAAFRAERPIDDRAARTLVIVCATVVGVGLGLAVIDRASAEWRTQLALVAVGVSGRSRRKVIVWSSLLPLLAVAPVTVALSVAADLSWSRVVHRPPVVSVVGPALVLLAVTLSWALLWVAAHALTRSQDSKAWRRE